MDVDYGRARPRSVEEAKFWLPRQASKYLGITTSELWKLWAKDGRLEVIICKDKRCFVAESVRRFKLRTAA